MDKDFYYFLNYFFLFHDSLFIWDTSNKLKWFNSAAKLVIKYVVTTGNLTQQLTSFGPIGCECRFLIRFWLSMVIVKSYSNLINRYLCFEIRDGYCKRMLSYAILIIKLHEIGCWVLMPPDPPILNELSSLIIPPNLFINGIISKYN